MTQTTTNIREAAEAVIKRWDSPLWRQEVGTAEIINNLRHALAAESAPAPVQADATETFEEWWQQNGQFVRAGGGDYEKTFAYRAWEAAAAQPAATPEGGKPVAEVCRNWSQARECIEGTWIAPLKDSPDMPVGTKLYLHPSAADGAQEVTGLVSRDAVTALFYEIPLALSTRELLIERVLALAGKDEA